MANVILSEKSDFVLCSHRGLSPADIVQDCLEKAKSLLLVCTNGFDIRSLPLESQHQYMSLLDDLVDLALRQFIISQSGIVDEKT